MPVGATEVACKFILNIAILLMAARAGGEAFKRIGQPEVLGELLIGILIGPYALGGMISDPVILKLGEVSLDGVKLNLMDIISLLAVIILLFTAGVETDVRQLVKYGPQAGAVAVGGVVFSFAAGYYVTLAFAPSLGLIGTHAFVAAIFMGAVLTATSVGITVRILQEYNRLNSAEGVTILGAAVIDDVLGIIVLGVVLSIATTGNVDLMHSTMLGILAFSFWIGMILIGFFLSNYISIFVERFGTVMALVAGFVISYLSTLVGLHPVIGAYAAGIMFSSAREKEGIERMMRPLYSVFVPLFFVTMGMMADWRAFESITVFGAILVLSAIVAKVGGCALPAKIFKFGWLESIRIGVGMVPRGEIGLVCAGVALMEGAITHSMYAAAVGVSILSTVVVPPLLSYLFRR